MQDPPADALSSQPSRDFVGSQLKFAEYESGLPAPAVQSKAVPGRPVGRISQLRCKRTRGEALTKAEKEELAAYCGRYTRRKKGAHLKGNREEQWTLLAERQGLPLSAWIQERVEKALHGPGEALRELREENQRSGTRWRSARRQRPARRRQQPPAVAHRGDGRQPRGGDGPGAAALGGPGVRAVP